ncbi:hypothetical protein SRHO_G00074550 [Serrasalmus rhombeus]
MDFSPELRTDLKAEPPQSLPFVPFALVTVILLHIIVAVVYHNKRTKGSTHTDSPTTSTPSVHFFIFIPVVFLLLGLGGIILWKYRGQRQGQIERGEQRGTKREQETQDDVTYFTVAHSNTTSLPTIPNAGDKTEYATIRVN